ncbi:gag/pol polyprotein [Tanacetum coccineum]
MKEEYNALMKNGTWSLVSRASNTNVVDGNPDTSLEAFSDADWNGDSDDRRWHQAMKEEYDALMKNGTWSLVSRASNTNVVEGNPDTSLEAFSDAKWAGDSDDRRCMGGFAIYLGSNLISWTACKQRTVSRSSTAAKTRLLLTLLLSSHGFKLFLMSLESFHLQLLYYDVTILVAQGDLRVQHISTDDQIANIFTKPLPTPRFLFLRSKLQDKLTSRD